jgi:transporter family-2 protein
MNVFLTFALMFLAGMALAVQPSINARLAQKVGLLESAGISFLVGTVVLLGLLPWLGRGSWRGLGQVAWWELTGGLLGAFYVSLVILAVPKIGTTAALAATIASQLVTGLLLDHFRFLGLRAIPLDAGRLAGACLLVAGAFLTFRK